MKVAHVDFAERRCLMRDLADVSDGLVVVDRLEMILELLAADRHALLDDQIGLDLRQRIPFDCVRGVGELEVVGMLEVGQRIRRQGAQPVQLRLFLFDAADKDGNHWEIIA